MQIIGFNFTKVSAERFMDFQGQPVINTDMEFLDLEREKLDILRDTEGIKATFRYSVIHEEKPQEKEEKKIKEEKESKGKKQGQVIFEGHIILSASKDEAKNIFKSWKKKELPNSLRLPLFNLILRKCSPRAVQLEDEINLPLHLPFPQIKPQNQE